MALEAHVSRQTDQTREALRQMETQLTTDLMEQVRVRRSAADRRSMGMGVSILNALGL